MTFAVRKYNLFSHFTDLYNKFILFSLMCFVFVSCSVPKSGVAPSEIPPGDPAVISNLVVTPTSATLSVLNTLNISVSGGQQPYTFSLVSGGGVLVPSVSDATYTAPGASGLATLQVSDSSGQSVDVTVTVNPALQISPASQVLMTNANLTFSSSGGVSPYAYSVVSGGGSVNATSGAFTAPATNANVVVRVTDSLGNTSDATVTVTSALALNPPTVTIAVNNSTTVSAIGGSSPYTYSVVSGGGSIGSTSGVYTAPATSGSATVRVTDSLGATADSVITINPALAISPTALNIVKNGTQNFSASGGVSPFSYSIVSGGGSINSSTGSFTAPATAGTVVVKVTDALSNTATATVTVVNSVSISPTTVTLAVNGTQTFSASGGVSPYTYSVVSGGGSINASTGAFTAPASSGTVVVRVTDSLSQTSDATVTVNGALTISPATKTLAVNNVFTFTASGGVSPYSYSVIAGGGSIGSTSGAYTAPATAGSATARVTDSLGNTADAAITINAALALSPVSVNVVASGTQSFSTTGGVSPYSYSIVSGGGSINSSTGAFIAPATAGTVVVRVTDALNNSTNSTVTVVSSVSISPATGTLAANGSQTFTASGGVSPYSYSIVSGGGSINASTGVFTAPATAGSVVVRVTDALLQTADATITVASGVIITPSTKTLAVNNVFTFSASGGVSPYTYSVVSGGGSINASTGAFTAPASSGTVVVRVTDSLSQTSDATVTVNGALTISPSTKILAVNNVFTFSASGGVSPYTYSVVSGGGSIGSTSGVYTAPATSGSATVRVTDSLGNVSNASVMINAALAISPAAVTLAVNGTQTFSASGGVSPYSYSVVSGGGSINTSTGAFTAPAVSSFVTVRVTDSLGNISESSVTVNGPLAISPTSANIVAGGVQTFVAAGGVPPYTYSMVSGAGSIDSVTGDYTAGAAGPDVVKVTDSASVSVTASVTVYNPLSLTPLAVTMPISSTQNFSASGGLGTLTFSILSGDGTIDPSTGVFTSGISAGTTEIEVVDTVGNSVSATISVVSSLTISPLTLKLPVFSTVTFTATLGTAPYSYSVLSGGGSVVPATGVYTGGSVAGVGSVQVSDAGMNTSVATVTHIEPVQIVGGGNHFCVRYNEGSVKCWGLNTNGQLGLGDTAARGDNANEGGANLPFVSLGTGRTAVDLIGGHTHSCAILDNGQVKCWGLNTSGQLGLGDTAARGDNANEMGDSLPAINLGTGRTAVKLAAGASHTCAILDNGQVKCWGLNTNGQLGIGSTATKGSTAGTMGDSLPAVNLGTGKTALQISAGLDHTCAILNDNSVKCWGRNIRGQLGIGSTTTMGTTTTTMGDSLPAVNLGAGRTAVKISAGYQTTCAILDNGTSKCWGLGTRGALGQNSTANIGTTAASMTSLAAIGLGFTATDITATRQRSCAISSAGNMKCWGLGTSGQLAQGNILTLGDAAGEMSTITNINFGTSVVASKMASSFYSSCVITTSKRIKCFGSATNGQLLNASTTAHIGDVSTELGDGMSWVNH